MVFRVLSDLHLEFYTTKSAGGDNGRGCAAQKLLRSIPAADDANADLLLAGDVGWCVRPRRVRYSQTLDALLQPSRLVEADADADASANAAAALLLDPAAKLPSAVNRQFVLLLAGLVRRFRSVTMVAGNHEYYVCRTNGRKVLSPDEVDVVLDVLCRRCGAVFLQKAERVVARTRILGCTLWAPFLGQAAVSMNDRHYVTPNVNLLRTKHVDHLDWIVERLDAPDDDDGGEYDSTVVMTHHLPLPGTHSGYFTNAVAVLCTRPRVWVCGHSHTAVDDDSYGTRVVSRPHGYPEEHGDANHTPLVFN